MYIGTMKRQLCFLFLHLLFFSQIGHAQDSVGRTMMIVSPALLTPNNFALQAGLSYPVSEGWALLAEAAVPPFKASHSAFTNVSTWRTGIEIKRYRQQAKRKGMYYSLQTAYLFRTLQEQDGTVIQGDGTRIGYDAATLRSPVVSVALKWGAEFTTAKEKRVTDVFFGFGLRQIFNNHSLRNGVTPPTTDVPVDKYGWFLPTEGWRYNHALTRFHFTAGFRVGFKL